MSFDIKNDCNGVNQLFIVIYSKYFNEFNKLDQLYQLTRISSRFFSQIKP